MMIIQDRTSISSNLHLTVLVLALAIAGGCSKPETQKSALPRPVRTITVAPQPIENSRTAVGDIRPRYESDLGFRVSGKITKRFVDVGASIRKGDLLAQLDDQDYRNRLTSAKTEVTTAQAVLVEAQAAEKRLRNLPGGNTTPATYDVALKNLRSAEAKLTSAKAAAKLAADQVGYCELRADFDGIVTAIGAEADQVVNIGQMAVRLTRPGDKDAVFSVAESDFSRRRQDGTLPEISVQLLSNPDITAHGKVREIAPVADATTRTFLVKVTLDNPPEEIRFGASVVGRLKVASEPVIVLPGSALFDKDGRPAVWVVDPVKHVVYLKPVTVARYETDRVILGQGLIEGDIVVTAGVNRLREQQQVALAEGSPEGSSK